MNNGLIILVLLAVANKENDSNTGTIHKLKDYTKNFKVDNRYTRDKIEIFKSILPYLPAKQIKTGARSIDATEKVLKILDLIEYLNLESAVPQALEIDNVERTYKIVSTLREEIDNSNIDQFGTILDVMINKEHYKEMVDMALELISNKERLNDPNSLSKILKLFLGEKEMENNNLNKILDILEMLNSEDQFKEQPNKDS